MYGLLVVAVDGHVAVEVCHRAPVQRVEVLVDVCLHGDECCNVVRVGGGRVSSGGGGGVCGVECNGDFP